MRYLTLLALLSTACWGTSFQPPPSPAIQVTISGLGSPTFWKDGKEIQSGFWGKDLLGVMEKIPRAKEMVETWRFRRMLSFVCSVASSLITASGLFIIQPGSGFDARNSFSLAMIIGGAFPISITSLILSQSADAYLWDAINLYNEDVRKGRAKPSVQLTPGGLSVRW